MKGFLIFVILSCFLITVAYIIKIYNKPKPKPKRKKPKDDLDIPIKDIIYRPNKNR